MKRDAKLGQRIYALGSSKVRKIQFHAIVDNIRHARRALTPEEVSLLVESARSSNVEVQGYSGELRARSYLMSFFTGLRRQELGSLTPKSLKFDDIQPTLTVDAACSKHLRKDTRPMHGELVLLVREWVREKGPNDLLFPRIERKKICLMFKKDLERVGIPNETHEGIADFHAAGRHRHITELLMHGVTLVQALELARHVDVRMTMKYTHIGLQDHADALAGVPNPNACSTGDSLDIGEDSCDVVGQGETPPDTDGPGGGSQQNDASPGAAGTCVVRCRKLSPDNRLRFSGGGGNCTRVPRFINEGVYVCIQDLDCRQERSLLTGIFKA